MTLGELNSLLAGGENIHLEFKQAQQGVPASLYETVAAFLNREGGLILLGVADQGEVLGLGDQNLMQLKQAIVTALNNPEVLNPPFPLSVNEFEHPSGKILYIRVPMSSLVHKHAGTVYDRENDSDFRITDETRIAALYARKRNVFTENEILPHLRISDLNAELFDWLRSRLLLVNANHPWLEASNERILRDARFWRRDYATGEEGLTLAAALVFGTDEVIGNLLPAYRIDILVRRDNADRYDDRLLLKTNLIHSYLQSLDFIKKQWPEKFYQQQQGDRVDLRELIFRELVANMIIHREYNHATPTEVIIYKDSVAVTNPNRMRFRGPLNLETFDAEPKNPNIRAFFNVLLWADELGSGVKNMNKFVQAYTDGAQPVFVEGEPFYSMIPMVAYKIKERYRLLVALSGLTEAKLGAGRVERLQELSLEGSLHELTDENELVLQLVGSWAKKSGELASMRFLINSELGMDALKKVGSWEKKSGEFLKKRGKVLLSTLLLSLKPISIEELANVLGYDSKERYRDDYVKVLKDHGLIAYTQEQANAPNQQYVITSRGIHFLTGNPL